MFENIRNVITRLPMDRLRPNLGGQIPRCPPRFGFHASGTLVCHTSPKIVQVRVKANLVMVLSFTTKNL